MKEHTKVYLDYFNLKISDFISCELCGGPACDIHHIDARGMGGTKRDETIDNLMALCRGCHEEFGDKTEYKDELRKVHQRYVDFHVKV